MHKVKQSDEKKCQNSVEFLFIEFFLKKEAKLY